MYYILWIMKSATDVWIDERALFFSWSTRGNLDFSENENVHDRRNIIKIIKVAQWQQKAEKFCSCTLGRIRKSSFYQMFQKTHRIRWFCKKLTWSRRAATILFNDDVIYRQKCFIFKRYCLIKICFCRRTALLVVGSGNKLPSRR